MMLGIDGRINPEIPMTPSPAQKNPEPPGRVRSRPGCPTDYKRAVDGGGGIVYSSIIHK